MYKVEKVKKNTYKITHMLYDPATGLLTSSVIVDNLNSTDLTTYLARSYVGYEEISLAYRRLKLGARAAYFGKENNLFYILEGVL